MNNFKRSKNITDALDIGKNRSEKKRFISVDIDMTLLSLDQLTKLQETQRANGEWKKVCQIQECIYDKIKEQVYR